MSPLSDIPRDRLALELRFHGDTRDSSGHDRHGVVHGAALTHDRFGRADRAYFFDGIDDYISVDPPPSLNDAALSVSVWARVDAIDRNGWSSAIVCQDDGNDDDQSRRVFQLSTFQGRPIWHLMMAAEDPSIRHPLPVGRWTHLAAVVEGGVHTLYVNGEAAGSTPCRLRAHRAQPVHVGRKGTDEPHFFFRGAISDVRVYSRALDAAEIRALFSEDGYTPPAPVRGAPPISGVWEAPERNLIDIAFDGQSTVTGTITAGRPTNVAAISHGTFDRATSRLVLDGVAINPWKHIEVPYHIDARLDGRRLHLHGQFGPTEVRTTLRRVSPWLRMARRMEDARNRFVHTIEPLLVPWVRWRRARLRHSKEHNLRALRARNESYASFVFREAVAADIPQLAALHVKTWAMTYPEVKRPPTLAIREPQWREAFDKDDGSWFCIVIENSKGELVGFAKGIVHKNGYGDLNKIYLLWEYHRLGLGRRLIGHAVRRFMAKGVTTMLLNADAANPSCGFYEAVGGEVRRDERGRPQRGAYIWRDLPAVAAACPADVEVC
jgi:GNAT superfamily N-acetyltransferase